MEQDCSVRCKPRHEYSRWYSRQVSVGRVNWASRTAVKQAALDQEAIQHRPFDRLRGDLRAGFFQAVRLYTARTEQP